MVGRSVIITGAGRGIGRAAALRYHASGDRLTLVCRDEDEGRALQDDINDQGGEALYIQADTSKKLDVHNVMAEAMDAYGRIDVLAHCAGMFFAAPFMETTEDDFTDVIDSNLRSAFLMNKSVAKQIIKQSETPDDGGVDIAHTGAIVNLITTEAVRANPEHAVFAATQGGIAQLTKAVAMTLSQYGARANAVGVASVKQELDIAELGDKLDKEQIVTNTPLARMGEPTEVANAIHFLSSSEASFITGQTLFVDGGRLAIQRQVSVKEETED